MRDTRDPQKLGEALLTQAPSVRSAFGKDIPLSEIYDVHVGHFDIPAYTSVHEDGPVQKYGTPADLEPKWAWIQVV